MALLGTLALRMGAGRLLEWDAASMRITNEDEANRYIDPPARAGWSS